LKFRQHRQQSGFAVFASRVLHSFPGQRVIEELLVVEADDGLAG
jgi:hypothetical protein